jgi:hypothetical protein
MAAPAPVAAKTTTSTVPVASVATGSRFERAVETLGLLTVEKKKLSRTALAEKKDNAQELLKEAQAAIRHEEVRGNIAAGRAEATEREKKFLAVLENMGKEMKKKLFGLAHTMKKQTEAVKQGLHTLEEKMIKELDAAKKAQLKAQRENMVKIQIKMTGIQEQMLKEANAREAQIDALKEEMGDQSKKQNAASQKRAEELKAQIEGLNRQNEENQRKLERELQENRREFEEVVNDLGADLKGKMNANQE